MNKPRATRKPATRSTKKQGAKTLKSIKKTVASRPTGRAASTATLAVGRKAPAFTVLDDQGRKVRLSDFRGRKVVLYFYPKDDTPGCTKEACAFRDGIDAIRDRRAVVLGMSADSVDSHRKFSEKFHLNFPLLSDGEKKVLQAYGVWKEKSLYGRKFMGIERTTVIIDEAGNIAHVFPKVKVDTHYQEVLKALG